MNRTVNKRNVPHPKPVKKVELSEKNTWLRLILVVLFLAVGVTALVYAFYSLLRGESGWREIQANSSSEEANCGDEFVFMYNVGASGISSSAESKAIVLLYTDAVELTYKLFHNDQEFDDVVNICYINKHPNEVMEVDAVLYEAFATMQEYENRSLYLAPMYEVYDNLFRCIDDSEIVSYDPYLNEELREEYVRTASYAGNPQAVDIQLLGDNKICLYVSEEYLSYAEETGITSFVDFAWMKNAFIIDYLADVMIENHYTLGSISSYDGFVRNLDDSGTAYSFNLYDRDGQTVYYAGVMQYTGEKSIVYLRNYKMNSMDSLHYYELANGEIRTPYLDGQDGLCKSSVNNLISYSGNLGCAEVLLKMMPIYIADEFDEAAVLSLEDDAIYSIYCREHVIYYNDADLMLTDLYDKEGVCYTTSLVE